MNAERILVIQTAYLGDAVLTLPMIQEIRKLYPGTELDVLCIPVSEEIFKSSDYIDNVIVYDKKGKGKSLFGLLKFALMIRKRKYAKIFSPHRSVRTSILVLFSGAGKRTGFNRSSLKWVYNYRVRYNPDEHEVKRNLCLTGIDVNEENWRIQPEIRISQENSLAAESVISRFSRLKTIAISPGAVWKTKIYPGFYYRVITDYLIKKGFNVVIIGGQQDKALCEELAYGFAGTVESAAGKLSPVGTVALLRKCTLLISNDSAPAHLGACAGIPVLMIYCSTVPGFGFYPYLHGGRSLSLNGLSCKPCGVHGLKKCPLGTFECGVGLKPERVIEQVEEILGLKE